MNQVTRVGILGINYGPEETGIAPYTTGLAEGLALHGYVVEAITGYPHYPDWKVAPGYTGLGRKERIAGVIVKRLRHYVPKKPSHIKRLVMEVSFGARAVMTQSSRNDVVVCVSPTLFSAAMMVAKVRLFRTRQHIVIWVQDFYGLGMSEMNQSKIGVSAWVLNTLEGWTFRNSHSIVSIHPLLKDHITASFNIPNNSVEVIRNWTHISVHGGTLSERSAMRSTLEWADDTIVVLHAGNMGAKQALENVVDTAALCELSGVQNILFVLMGNGNRRPQIELAAAGKRCLSVIDFVPADQFAAVLGAADILLINEGVDVKSMAVPSKLTSYFATGLPVIAATASDGATAYEIANSGAGTRVPAADPRALLDEVVRLANDGRSRSSHGKNGREYVNHNLSAPAAVSAFVSLIEGVRTKTPSGQFDDTLVRARSESR